MSEYQLAGKGLQTVFRGTIVGILGAILIWIPLVGAVISLAGSVMVLYGLYTASAAHENFKTAFYLEIVASVLTFLGSVWKEGFFGGVLDILSLAVEFLVTYFICVTAGALLSAKGDRPLADRAELIVKLYLACSVVAILCILVSWVPLVNILAAVAGGLAGFVKVGAYILLIYFYYQASKSLLA